MQREQQETEIVINRIRKNEWDFENFTHQIWIVNIRAKHVNKKVQMNHTWFRVLYRQLAVFSKERRVRGKKRETVPLSHPVACRVPTTWRESRQVPPVVWLKNIENDQRLNNRQNSGHIVSVRKRREEERGEVGLYEILKLSFAALFWRSRCSSTTRKWRRRWCTRLVDNVIQSDLSIVTEVVQGYSFALYDFAIQHPLVRQFPAFD